ncbi:MAG: hypothetical protein NW237_15745 [Cyanobacteriota bacterium]|nr:hypothetical protein [Cyanobacteriota bacterium]
MTEHLIRLHRFDLRSTEKSKELLIDAILQEGIQKFDRLKIWKGAYIQSDHLCGSPDYLLADDREYLETPFLSIIEAKRDDFEQGLSQCLPAMQVCSWINRHHSPVVDTYGIVTNRVGWQFYKLTTGGDVYEPRFMP